MRARACMCAYLRMCACLHSPFAMLLFFFHLGHMIFLNDYSESDVVNFGSQSNHKDMGWACVT